MIILGGRCPLGHVAEASCENSHGCNPSSNPRWHSRLLPQADSSRVPPSSLSSPSLASTRVGLDVITRSPFDRVFRCPDSPCEQLPAQRPVQSCHCRHPFLCSRRAYVPQFYAFFPADPETLDVMYSVRKRFFKGQ